MAAPRRKLLYDPHSVACAAQEKHELKYLIRRMGDFEQQLTKTINHEKHLQDKINRRIAAITRARMSGEELRRQEAERNKIREIEERKRKLEKRKASHSSFITNPALFVAPLAAEESRIARCKDRARRLASSGIKPPENPMEDHAKFTWTLYQTAVNRRCIPIFKILRVPHDIEVEAVGARKKIAKEDKAENAGCSARTTRSRSGGFSRTDSHSPTSGEETAHRKEPVVVGGVVIISDSDDD